MAEIINLRTVRKQKARAEKQEQAAENRERFGQTKAAKQLSEARSDKATKDLDAHKLNDE